MRHFVANIDGFHLEPPWIDNGRSVCKRFNSFRSVMEKCPHCDISRAALEHPRIPGQADDREN
eukprot:7834473-Pyramimonas_sp.AAC.1